MVNKDIVVWFRDRIYSVNGVPDKYNAVFVDLNLVEDEIGDSSKCKVVTKYEDNLYKIHLETDGVGFSWEFTEKKNFEKLMKELIDIFVGYKMKEDENGYWHMPDEGH